MIYTIGKNIVLGILSFASSSLLLDGAETGELIQAAPAVESWNLASIPAAFPVGFCLLSHGKKQYAAYYDADHHLTVASRQLDSNQWEYQILPSKVGWDSHNYITMAMDDNGYIHLSGNMHADALVYFRTSKAGDIGSFERIAAMTGDNETRTTYPKFVRGADGRLIFHYRSGASGNGKEINAPASRLKKSCRGAKSKCLSVTVDRYRRRWRDGQSSGLG